MPKRLLVVFGNRTAEEILAALRLCGDSEFDSAIRYFFEDDLPDDERLAGVPTGFDTYHYCIGVLDHSIRREIETSMNRRGWVPHTVIHPSAVIDESAKIGGGCFIGAMAAVSIDAVIGEHSIIHMQSTVGHDSVVGRHCAVLPGARISGQVTLGDAVLVGSNAFVYQGSRIGDHAQIDAMTYVRGDKPGGHIYSIRHPGPIKRPGFS